MYKDTKKYHFQKIYLLAELVHFFVNHVFVIRFYIQFRGYDGTTRTTPRSTPGTTCHQSKWRSFEVHRMFYSVWLPAQYSGNVSDQKTDVCSFADTIHCVLAFFTNVVACWLASKNLLYNSSFLLLHKAWELLFSYLCCLGKKVFVKCEPLSMEISTLTINFCPAYARSAFKWLVSICQFCQVPYETPSDFPSTTCHQSK